MTQFDLFDAYYKITEVSNNMPVLFGSTKECAICVYENRLEGWSIWLIRMAKDLLETDIKASIMADFSLPFVDDDNNVSAAKSLIYDETPDLSSLHPIAQYLIGEDLEAGMGPEDILEKRGAILVREFLGFTPDHVAIVYPDLFVERHAEIDGVESTFVDFNFGTIA